VHELLRPRLQRVFVRLAMIENRLRGNFRKYRLPIFETWPSRSLPPDEFCLGVRPRKAANSTTTILAQLSYLDNFFGFH
jgi:hypothetical protein